MERALDSYVSFVVGVKYALFGLAVLAGLIALLDWAVRTRKINPFGPVARFSRRFIDPLMRPIEQRIVRSGGQPKNAPLWMVGSIIVGGLLLIWVLERMVPMLGGMVVGFRTPLGTARVLLAWTFMLLRLALIVRVVSTWFGMSPYSKWVRWSYVLTEWMIAPLRRVIPPFGPVDVTPLVAYILLVIAQSVIGA